MTPRPSRGRRWGRSCALGVASVLICVVAQGADPPLYADLDDDDDDGVADVEQATWSLSEQGRRWNGALLDRAARPPAVRGPARYGHTSDGWQLRGTAAGTASVAAVAAPAGDGRAHDVAVVEVRAVDEAGARVDLATSRASLSRELPRELLAPDQLAPADPDALRWIFIGPADALPAMVELGSTDAARAPLDQLQGVPLVRVPCPSDVDDAFECRSTPSIRAAIDDVDRAHPAIAQRSIHARVGGRITLYAEGRVAASIRVGAPRGGPVDRWHAQLRVRIVRIAPGAGTAVGADVAQAIARVRDEVTHAGEVWGQCGLTFDDADVAVLETPLPSFLAVGCGRPLPASGGRLTFSVEGRRFDLPTRPGARPAAVARSIEAALLRAGLEPDVRTPSAALYDGARGADVLVRARGVGVPVEGVAGVPLSSDPTLALCIGRATLTDGFAHFSDLDAQTGTLEERALAYLVDDGDPHTIDVAVIPAFAASGRIGETFLAAPGSTFSDLVVVDRQGLRASARAFTLAHELGHLLLAQPGHADDFAVDAATSLMDSDAADPSIFGPRHLSLAECQRMISESGPRAAAPLVQARPLAGPRKRPGAEARPSVAPARPSTR